jgi:hypothetical protein
LDFVLAKYEEKGVEELDEEKLPILFLFSITPSISKI